MNYLTKTFFALSLVSSLSLATTQNDVQVTFPAPIAGGKSHHFYIRVDRLVPNLHYLISCKYTITREKTGESLEVLMNNLTDMAMNLPGGAIVEAHHQVYTLLEDQSGQFSLNYSAVNPQHDEEFTISNLDSFDTVLNVKSCFATLKGNS